MDIIIAKMLLVGGGVAISQDAIASVWFYWKKEPFSNQAFRITRLIIGVGFVIIGVVL